MIIISFGEGFDRHMYALCTLAEEVGLLTEIFEDPSYQNMSHIILSTSTLL